MFFIQEDYKKIQEWLYRNSVKDTEFPITDTLNGNEIITIVQEGKNKKVFLKDLVAQVFNLGISDFVNITDKYNAPNISLEEAIRLIPSRARKKGQVITFLDREGHWHIYQFKGVLNQWNVLDTWEDLFDWEKIIIDSILPDEEDLTKSLPDENGNSYLSLKDREYNPEDFSGLGRIILRKNIIEIEDPIYGKVKKNILYQNMINKSNTIYEIRYDFDLDGEELTIPEGCVLDFRGGNFSNGAIIGNMTHIIYEQKFIFDKIVISGSWNIPIINSYIFKDINEDDVIKNLFLLSHKDVQNTIIVETNVNCYVSIDESDINALKCNSNTNLIINGKINLKPTSLSNYCIISLNDCTNVKITGDGIINGDVNEHTGTTGEWGMGINILNSNNIEVNGLSIKNCWGDCVYIGNNSYNIVIQNCKLKRARRQGISITYGYNIEIYNCEICDIYGTAPEFAIDIEPNENEYAHHINIKNIIVYNCFGGIYCNGNHNVVHDIMIEDSTFTPDASLHNYSSYIIIGFSNKCILRNCKITEVSGVTDETYRTIIAFYNSDNTLIENNELYLEGTFVMFSSSGDIDGTCIVKQNKLLGNLSSLIKFPRRYVFQDNIIECNKLNHTIQTLDWTSLELTNNTITCADCNLTNIYKVNSKHNIFKGENLWIFKTFEDSLHANNVYESGVAFYNENDSLLQIDSNIIKSGTLTVNANNVILSNNKFDGRSISIGGSNINMFNNLLTCTSFVFTSVKSAMTNNTIVSSIETISVTVHKSIISNNNFKAPKIIRLTTVLEDTGGNIITENKFTYTGNNIITQLMVVYFNDSIFANNIIVTNDLCNYAIGIYNGPGIVYGNTIVGNVDASEYRVDPSCNNVASIFESSFGSSEKRPSLSKKGELSTNYQFFDTTLNKPIWWTGTKWVDATGADV